MDVLLLVFGIVFFIGLIIVHELGHFIVARRNGVDVEEFGIGFPPTIWSKRMKSGFDFSINLLPLGGFVRLRGENEAEKGKGTLGAATLWAKVKIMLAGVTANLAVAYILLVILALVGMPRLIENQYTVQTDTKVVQDVRNKNVVLVAEVLDDTPAERAGIEAGDRIISVNGERITGPEQVGGITSAHAGQEVPVVVQRGDKQETKTIRLNDKDEGKGYLGTVSETGQRGVQVRKSTWSAPIVAAGVTGQFAKLTMEGIGKALGNLFTGNGKKASEQVAGPVGIFVILREGTSLGINFVLMLVAIISLTLALINALPIPALDGGRLFVTLLFRAIRQPLTKRREDIIHGTGFLLLMALFVLITIVDIKRFF
jgi:regulator of sigma E protease